MATLLSCGGKTQAIPAEVAISRSFTSPNHWAAANEQLRES